VARYAACVEQALGRWEISFPQLPGCLAVGETPSAAKESAPEAIHAYLAWRRAHGHTAAEVDAQPVAEVREIHREWPHPQDPRYNVRAFFATDAPALTASEVDELLDILAWSRDDLGRAVAGLSEAAQTWEHADGWSVVDIVDHIGRTEWWCLGRIGLAPSDDVVPATSLQRLNIAREQLLGVLPGLVGVAGVVEVQGELWSPRKVLRRALCHERDHTAQILALRAQMPPNGSLDERLSAT